MSTERAASEIDPQVSFAGLALATTGWIFIMLWLYTVRSGPLAYVVTTIFALFLAAIFRLNFSPSPNQSTKSSRNSSRIDTMLTPSRILQTSVLFAVGMLPGILGMTSSIILLLLFSFAFCCMPWHRFPLSRFRPTFGCFCLSTGVILTLLIDFDNIIPIYLPIATWIFWAASGVSYFWRTTKASGKKGMKTGRPSKSTNYKNDTYGLPD